MHSNSQCRELHCVSQPTASVEAVTALGVLGALNVEQRRRLLREAARVLKPGGVLIVVQRRKLPLRRRICSGF